MVARIGPGEALAGSVAAGDIPGVVALAADADGVIFAGAFGERELGSGVAMTLDTVCWTASMTKATTSVAAMQLVEQGRLGLDEPVSAVVPQLAGVQVLDGFDAAGVPRLRAPKRPITLRHLLTHTAGFSYDTWNVDIGRYAAYARLTGVGRSQNEALPSPLVHDPGDCWEYGTNTDWAGKAVEAVSGVTLDVYLREHVFEPLGMRDSDFVVGAEQRSRLASRHVRQADGTLRVVASEPPRAPQFFMGGGGLYSTGPDYVKFLRMLLQDGTFEGVQILRPETVAEMGRNQIGDLTAGVLRTALPASSNDHDPYPGMPIKWGLGYMITPEPTPAGRAANSLAWAGLANTYYWIDPASQITGVLLTQILPFVDARVIEAYTRFERDIYALKPA
jgi:methyl acetate hydrolase